MKSAFNITMLLFACFFANPTAATEYDFRKLMANTLPSAQCDTDNKAQERAQKSYTIDRNSKKFCQTQGYGWHVHEIEDPGKTVCTECSDKKGLKKCHQDDVIVTCQRIKPGSVGMLPGKG